MVRTFAYGFILFVWALWFGRARADRPARDELLKSLPQRDLVDFTAYTIPQRAWRLGPWAQEYGVFDNAALRVRLGTAVYQIPNIGAKVTAIRQGWFELSGEAEAYAMDLTRFGVPNGEAYLTPVTVITSYRLHPRVRMHLGFGWWRGSLEGDVSAKEIAGAIEQMTGANISRAFVRKVNVDGYSRMDMTLLRPQAALDWSFSARHGAVLVWKKFTELDGTIIAQARQRDGDVMVGGGGSASFRLPLTQATGGGLRETVMTTLSWQGNWERFHLRVGLPLPVRNAFAYPQAIDAWWVLGPRARPAPPDPESP